MSLILQIINENRSIEEQIHALLEENKQMICYCNDIVKKSYQNDEFLKRGGRLYDFNVACRPSLVAWADCL